MGGTSWIEDPFTPQLPQFLLQVTLIVVVVRVIGRLLTKIQQPMVIGEIIAGIILGPSVMGFIPHFSQTVFTPISIPYLSLFASVGLIFFMFFLGMEVEPRLMKKTWRTSLPIAVAAIALPFGSGIGVAHWLSDLNTADKNATNISVPNNTNVLAFYLFFGTAMSFTAFPVLARILTSARLVTSPLGIEVLATAAIDDLLAWSTLAFVLSYASGGSGVGGLYVILTAIGAILLLAFPVRIGLLRWHSKLLADNDELNRNFIAVLFLGLTITSWFFAIIGVEAFFGAFVFGLVVPKQGNLINELAPRIELLIVEFFLPLYFANSGLKTDISKLNTGELWGMTVAVTIIAFFAKTTPTTLLARWFSTWGKNPQVKSWKYCLTMGVLMDTRGLVALIVMNIGLSLGILGTKVFTMLVIMCLATTFLSPPLVQRLYAEEYHQQQQAAAAIQEENHLQMTLEDQLAGEKQLLTPGRRLAVNGTGVAVDDKLHAVESDSIELQEQKLGPVHQKAASMISFGTTATSPYAVQRDRAGYLNATRRNRTTSRWHVGIEAAISGMAEHELEAKDAYVADQIQIPIASSRHSREPSRSNTFNTMKSPGTGRLERALSDPEETETYHDDSQQQQQPGLLRGISTGLSSLMGMSPNSHSKPVAQRTPNVQASPAITATTIATHNLTAGNSFLAHRRSDDGVAASLQQTLAEEDDHTLRQRTTPKSKTISQPAATEAT